jgi:acyl-CoA reductase-like NAD-dependent aldehyde dehydrogenase
LVNGEVPGSEDPGEVFDAGPVDDLRGVGDEASKEVVAEVPRSGAKDVARAVEAAVAALPAWAARPAAERVALCAAVAGALKERAEDLAETIVNELGMPLPLTRLIQVGAPT